MDALTALALWIDASLSASLHFSLLKGKSTGLQW